MPRTVDEMPPMSRLRMKLKVLAVLISEQAGWLSGVREDVVYRYLYDSRASLPKLSALRVRSFPNLSFAVLASGVVASVLLIAQFPPLQLDDIIKSREQRAIAQYSRLITTQNIAEDRSSPLQPDSIKSLEEARAQVAEMVLQVRDLQRATYQPRNSELTNTAAQLRSIELAMKIGSADDEWAAILASVRSTGDTPAKAFAINTKYSSHISSALEEAKVQLDSLPPNVYAYAGQSGRHVISREQALSRKAEFPELRPEEAESRLPEAYKDWNGFVSDNGQPYDPEEVTKGERLRSVAGGVVLSSTSVSPRNKDFSSFILTYEPTTERLALVGQNSEVYYSEPIAPQTLKALNAFVLKGQTIAVSVGWSGKHEMSDHSGQQVLLDPVFVDTVAGRNLVRADSLPWEFSRTTIAGWPNPIANAFKATQETLTREIPNTLGAYLHRHPASPEELSKLAEKDDLEAQLDSCAIDADTANVLILLIKNRYPRLSNEAALQVAYDSLVKPVLLATLYDKDPSFSLEPGMLVLSSGIEYRYVTSRVEYGDKIRFGKCLSGPDVQQLGALNKLVNAQVQEIIASFPAIQQVRDYAGIAAFLRWARTPGHLQAVDFYPLLKVSGHDEHKTPTPDLVQ